VLWREVERDAMAWVAKKSLPRGHRLKDAGFSLLAEIVLDATKVSYQTCDALGHVGIEVVAHHSPWRGRRRRCEQILHECDEILFRAGIADRATHLAGRDIERRDQGLGAMPDVFELTSFDMPWLHWQTFGDAFQAWMPVISLIETV
jgi:hypothetical protein